MSNDWYIEVGRQRMAEIAAGRAQAQADLELAKRDNDQYSAAAALQNIADIDQAQANLTRLYDQYIASQTPPPPATDQEILAKPLQSMTHDEWFRFLSKNTKHGLDANSYREGMAEVQRRRARGE
jgi:hypothetical protein